MKAQLSRGLILAAFVLAVLAGVGVTLGRLGELDLDSLALAAAFASVLVR